jgi:hypothetical protein
MTNAFQHYAAVILFPHNGNINKLIYEQCFLSFVVSELHYSQAPGPNYAVPGGVRRKTRRIAT